MKTIIVKPFDKTINVPLSKSYLNRCLILASMNPKPVKIHGVSLATDVVNLINCLRVIGLEIEVTENLITINNSFPNCEIPNEKITELKVYDGGTTTRFLIPLLSLGKNQYRIMMSEKMGQRPLDQLINALIMLNVEVKKSDNILEIRGPAIPCLELTIDCSKTSQEASGLELVFSPQVKIILNNLSNSSKYLLLTENLVSKRNQPDFYPPLDFSSLSYPAVLAAVTGKVLIRNCYEIDFSQGDAELFRIFDRIGIKYNFSQTGLKIESGTEYSGFTQDCADCLDLVPTLCFLAAYANSESIFTNLKNLKFKESDRLSEIEKILTEFKVIHHYDENKDELKINGKTSQVIKTNIMTVADHRIVMMSYLFLRKNNGGQLNMIESVNKSFPSFFEMME